MADGPDEREQHDERGTASGGRAGRVRIMGAEPVSRLARDNHEVPEAGPGVSPPEPAGTPALGDEGIAEPPRSHGAHDGGQGGVQDDLPWPKPDAAEPQLPHWTEAPTGEVPAVLSRSDPEDAANDPWSTLPTPSWREENTDWEAQEEAYEPSMLAKDETPLGSLNPESQEVPWDFDVLDRPAIRADEPTAAHPVVTRDQPPNPEAPSLGRSVPGGQEEPSPMVIEDADWPTSGQRSQVAPTGAQGPPGVRVPGSDSGSDPGVGEEEPWRSPLDELREQPPTGSIASPLEEPSAVPSREVRRVTSSTMPPPDSPGGMVSGPGEPYDLEQAIPSQPPPPTRSRRPRVPKRLGLHLDRRPSPEPAPAGPDQDVAPPPARHRRPAPRRGGEPLPRPEGAGRNLPVAVASGLGIGIITLACFALGNVASIVLITILVALAAVEGYAALRRGGYQPATLLGILGTVALMIAVYNKGQEAVPLIVVLMVVFGFIWYLADVEEVREPVTSVAMTVFFFAWIGVCGSYAALFLNPTLFPDRRGIAFLLGAIVTAVAYDIGALGVGRWIGRRPLAPSVSPNKTWEGIIGGAVAAFLVAIVIVRAIHPWTVGDAAALGIVVAVVAPVGDLCESMMKRHLGLKDMGRLVPGHGGLLDRIDGLLFVIPATYYLVKAIHLG